MEFKKYMCLILVTTNLLGISTLANSGDMKFSNNTKYNLSFSINNVCSKELGDIEKRTIKIINATNFTEACKYNPNQCVIDVYNAEGCTGKAVSNMIFDKEKIISTASGGDIMIGGNDFNVFFSNLSI